MTEKLLEDCAQPKQKRSTLPYLYAMGKSIGQCQDLSDIVSTLLSVMKDCIGASSGMFTLYNRRTGKIFIHESIGLTAEEEARGIYRLGEGITGKVVETGKAIIVPNIGEEPNFLGRSKSICVDTMDHSFICIPVSHGKHVLGTISIEKYYSGQAALTKDVELLEFIAAIIAQAVEVYLFQNEEKVFLENENRRLQNALRDKFHPGNIIGHSTPMQEVYDLIEKTSKARVTVLLLGESGVGKELVASALHYASPWADGPFIKFNCASLPESLIESELFGHERGAFTGADTQRKGRFEEADGGSIFLDEIGDFALPMQTKLLRVLQEHCLERLGGSKEINVNIRVLAATNRNLLAMVQKGEFREDLYYRLNVFPILIPPLRERGSDIIELAEHFLGKYVLETKKPIRGISSAALQLLMNYSWPGNVRELENLIERAVLLCDEDTIQPYNLPPTLQKGFIPSTSFTTNLESRIEAIEYEFLQEALQKHQGRMTDAAKELGMTRRMLGLRMKKYKLSYKVFRNLD